MSERDDMSEQAHHEPAASVLERPVPTLGEMAEVFRKWQALGVTRASIEYSLDRVYVPEDTAPVETTSEAVQHLISQGEQGLNYMLSLQRNVESVWGRLPDPKNPDQVSTYIREVILCATDELHEVLAEVHWKPWKDARGIKDISKYRGEMADVLHFILDLYLAGGISGREIIVDYMTKHYENLARNKSTAYRAS